MIKINLLGQPPPKNKRKRAPSPLTQPSTSEAAKSRAADDGGLTVISLAMPSLRMLADMALEEDSADRLGFQPYARALAGLIDSPNTMTPLALAINAPWGAGKTTLALMIERILKRKPSVTGKGRHVTCWFKSWMHDDAPNLASAFAAEIAQAANCARSRWQRFIEPLPSTLLPFAKRHSFLRSLVVFDILLLIYCAAELYFPAARSLSTRVASLVAIAGFATLAKPLSGLASFVPTLAKFVKDPRDVAASASMNEVSKQLHGLIRQATRNGGRFIIFVDDLERCRPPRAVDVLEVVNQLLNHDGVVTIIIADIPALAACAEIKYKELAARYAPGGNPGLAGVVRSYGRSYLQKIIQLQFDLPAHSPTKIRALIEELAKKSGSTTQTAKLGMSELVSHLGVGIKELWRATFGSGIIERLRSRIDIEIARRVVSTPEDFVGLERAVARGLTDSVPRTLLEDLVRERIQLRLSDDSQVMMEAQDEVMDYVEPFPRHAKRLLNRLRLLIFIAHEKRMFGGTPPLSPRHVGKWAVLCERWPELAQAISEDSAVMAKLEKPDFFAHLVHELAPIYDHDIALKNFCLSRRGTKLARLIDRIVQFSHASEGSSGRKNAPKSSTKIGVS